ncbi:hypothetical protein BCR32DRAFT_280843 [Anaeromyces robustus]|uniref:Uncharacterized protein n=1 Tax=Anaeromyces robustus TaxID=1754192 RepID=A0A1Y1X420_9FUNG|nr:hypothetical protein BCR32DRAFT_280843 [Anaeromyces robustus]|eukprot:ORX80064.1 hypothetical protein BCR32DRAFT_280843 [Anaeromyces robustus]
MKLSIILILFMVIDLSLCSLDSDPTLNHNSCETFYICPGDVHENESKKNKGQQDVCNHVKLFSTNTPNNEKRFDMVKDKNSHSCYIYLLLFDENCDKADKLTAGECIDLDHLIIAYC